MDKKLEEILDFLEEREKGTKEEWNKTRDDIRIKEEYKLAAMTREDEAEFIHKTILGILGLHMKK